MRDAPKQLGHTTPYVLNTGRSAEGQQQPRNLEVLQKQEFVKQDLMLRSVLDKLRLDVLSRASGRAKNTDALLVGGERRVSDPNALAVWRGG